MARGSEIKNGEHGLEIAILVVGGIIVLWLVVSESVAILVGGHHWLPNLSSLFRALYYTISRGSPVAGWSTADRKDLPSSSVFIVTAMAEIIVVGTGIWWLQRRGILSRNRTHDKHSRAPSRHEIKHHLSVTALRERTSHLRENGKEIAWKHSTQPEHIGVYLGRETTTHQDVWAGQDDSILMIGPPGSGKTSGFIVPAVVEAPAACIATSTREELVTLTSGRRIANNHPAWVFAPQIEITAHGVRPLLWSPIEGCENYLTAITRATSLVKGGAGFGSSTTNADFWEQSGIAVMRCYLMAAAVGNKSMEDIVQWSTAPSAQTPRDILRDVAPGWGAELEQMSMGGSQLIGSIWSGVRRALDCFADPRVLAACSQGSNFDIKEFLDTQGTAYFVGSGSAQMSIAPLVSALVEAIAEGARQSGGRGHLKEPLSLILDEAANIAPLPTLPSLLSDGGGSGIQLLVVLQSLAQGRHRWSPAEMDAMWDASTIKIILPGMSHAQDLEAISKLSGEIEEVRISKTSGTGGSSTADTPVMIPAWSPEQIRGLETGHALVLHRRLKPIEVITTPYWERAKRWDALVTTDGNR